ncbi:MAG: DNA polymerase III subunit beta [Dictyoglomus turgidum]
MKFITQKEDLYKSLQFVKSAVATKTTIPILTYVYMKAENDTLYLQGNNLEIGLALSMPVIVEEPGEVCLPASLFIDVIGKLPEVTLEIHVNERNRAVIHAGYSDIEIQGESTEEFPKVEIGNIGEYHASFDRILFAKAIKQTIFAAAEDEIKQVLTGVLFEGKEGKLNMVAVDGHRLALKTLEIEKDFAPIIVPSKSLKEWQKIITKAMDDRVNMAALDNQVVFNCGEIYFISRLLQGQFPAYDKIIPTDFTASFKANRKDFLDVLGRMEVFAEIDQTNTVKISLSSEEVVISTLPSERGFAKEVLPAEVEIDGNLEIGFNVEYLMDPLDNADWDEVVMRFTSDLGPALITSPEDENYTYILMPVRL